MRIAIDHVIWEGCAIFNDENKNKILYSEHDIRNWLMRFLSDISNFNGVRYGEAINRHHYARPIGIVNHCGLLTTS